jgi:hypothetical protein
MLDGLGAEKGKLLPEGQWRGERAERGSFSQRESGGEREQREGSFSQREWRGEREERGKPPQRGSGGNREQRGEPPPEAERKEQWAASSSLAPTHPWSNFP